METPSLWACLFWSVCGFFALKGLVVLVAAVLGTLARYRGARRRAKIVGELRREVRAVGQAERMREALAARRQNYLQELRAKNQANLNGKPGRPEE